MKNKGETKSFLGLPMHWELKNAFKGLWNKNDDRVFPPKYFGIGWIVNFHALAKKLNPSVVQDDKSASRKNKK